jgi:MFS family permease
VSVASVLLSTFLNLLGFTMTIPINVALRDHFALKMGASFGSLSSAYPLGTFGALFLWPRLSDRVGRRPVMALSLGGTGLGLALQATAIARGWPVTAFLGCRFLTGCFAGASPVGKALLADIGAATGQLPRFMAWRDAATTLAFILGPWIGGWVFDSTG